MWMTPYISGVGSEVMWMTPYIYGVDLCQGHAMFTRHAGSNLPCPPIDFLEGFNGFMAWAYDIPVKTTARAAVKDKYGVEFGKYVGAFVSI